MRHSLSVLEKYYSPGTSCVTTAHVNSNSLPPFPKHEADDTDAISVMSAPGMLGLQGRGGLYTGPTSAASHLAMVNSPVTMSTSSGLHSFRMKVLIPIKWKILNPNSLSMNTTMTL
jgi:hypothetical protein